MRRNRDAKIVATLGPASSTEAQISELFEAGVDVFRMNFSHGEHEGHRERYNIVRGLEQKYGRAVAILLDLQGPKLRVGDFEGGSVELKSGQKFRLEAKLQVGNTEVACLPHPEVFDALEPGTDLLLDDGRLRLKVLEHGNDWAETEVVIGGELSNHKGLNVPSVILDVSPLTPKDIEDMRFGLDLGVDFVGLSFVQRPEDIAEAKKMIAGRAHVISKLEKPQALHRLDEIVDLSDAIMVARGDLGVEVPPEDVPLLQKRILRACRRAGKPVIVATQMLDSMIHAPTPTRAEASDVATAIYDGADAVMLSAETAVGDYARESVAMMDRIIMRVEKDSVYREMRENERRAPEATAADAITAAARQVADTISAAAVVTFSTTGSTTIRAARERPVVPILGLTPRVDTARRSALIWGVHSVQTQDCHTFREMVTKAIHAAKTEGFAEPGDPIVITAGVPFGTPGATNILRIAWVE
ncbi:MAG: pyruvate kinase [Rhodospirillales bacterium]|nr:pyruvate kinase [Rhodospirillales bacterium]